MTPQEKEQRLLNLEAARLDAQNQLNASDYIDNQLIEGIDVDKKFNNVTNYPQFGGDWRKFRADRREQVRTLTLEIETIKNTPTEEPTIESHEDLE